MSGTVWPIIEPASGQIAFYHNYKEPLVPVKDGYGFEGVLLFDEWSEKVQCHICGKWKTGLGSHVASHGITAKEYKDQFGLRQGTALVGEVTRERLVKNGVANRRYLTKEANARGIRRANAAARVSQRVGRTPLETKNKMGICPAQILDAIQQNPEWHRDTAPQSLASAAIRTFGSWSKARAEAGLVPRNVNWREQFDREVAVQGLRVFFDQHHRAPKRSDMRRGMLPYTTAQYERGFGTWNQAMLAAGITPNRPRANQRLTPTA